VPASRHPPSPLIVNLDGLLPREDRITNDESAARKVQDTVGFTARGRRQRHRGDAAGLFSLPPGRRRDHRRRGGRAMKIIHGSLSGVSVAAMMQSTFESPSEEGGKGVALMPSSA